jgi:hypothetical protein
MNLDGVFLIEIQKEFEIVVCELILVSVWVRLILVVAEFWSDPFEWLWWLWLLVELMVFGEWEWDFAI